MADSSLSLYLKNLREAQPGDLGPLSDLNKPSSGMKEIGLLERPGRFVSELLTGGDPMSALLHGQAEKESLGYQVFKGAQKPGFQVGDLGAFAIDALTDPLTYALGPLIGKLGAAAGFVLPKAQKAKIFQEMAVDIMEKAMPAAAKRNRLVGSLKGLGIDPKWESKILEDIGKEFGDKALGVGAKSGQRAFKFLKNDQVDLTLSKLMQYEVEHMAKLGGIGGSIRRTMALQLSPVSSVFRNHGGVWGGKIANSLDDMQRTMIANVGEIDSQFIDILKKAGLYKGSAANIAVRSAASLLVEAGATARKLGAVSDDALAAVVKNYGVVDDAILDALKDPRAMRLAEWLAGTTESRGIQMGAFRDFTGKGFMTQMADDTGKKVVRPLEEVLEKNYVPHMWETNWKKGNAKFEKAARAELKRMKAALPGAEIGMDAARTRLMMNVVNKPPKVGTINYGRTQNAGGYQLDPAEWFPRYMLQTEEQLQFAKPFLVNGDTLTILEDGMKSAERLPGNWIDSVGQMIRGRWGGADQETSKIVSRMTAFQVVTKMGVGSTISNASQSINTITRDGFFNFAKGFVHGFSDEGHRVGLLAYNRSVREAMAEAAGHSTKGMAAKYLDYTGFTGIEKWNRFMAANSSVVTVKRMAEKYTRTGSKKLYERLKKYGLDESDIQRLQAGGGLGRQATDRVALIGAEVTQHATNWHQLPKVWQVPEMRIFLQYKNFAYNQTRFMFNEVVQPAFAFIGSGGKQGSIAPLLRIAPLFVGAGQGVAHIRDLLKIPVRGIATGDWKSREEWFWDSDDWFADALRDTLMVGSLGIVGDSIEAAERGKFPSMLLGPTIGDVTDLGSKLAQMGSRKAAGKPYDRQWQNFSNWLVRRIPGVSANIPYDVTAKLTGK